MLNQLQNNSSDFGTSLLNRVLDVPACLHALRAYILACLKRLLAFMLVCLVCFRSYMLTWMSWFRANVFASLTWLRGYGLSFLAYWCTLTCSSAYRAWRACVLTALYVSVLTFLSNYFFYFHFTNSKNQGFEIKNERHAYIKCVC